MFKLEYSITKSGYYSDFCIIFTFLIIKGKISNSYVTISFIFTALKLIFISIASPTGSLPTNFCNSKVSLNVPDTKGRI